MSGEAIFCELCFSVLLFDKDALKCSKFCVMEMNHPDRLFIESRREQDAHTDPKI